MIECGKRNGAKVKKAMAAKLTYEFVNKQFEKRGYILTSTEYINTRQNLEYFCPKGHPGTICYANFSQGAGCKECSYIERGIKKRQIIKETDSGTKLKQCSKCRRWLPLTTCFYPSSLSWHGYGSQCKDCQEQYRNSVAKKRNDNQKKNVDFNPLYMILMLYKLIFAKKLENLQKTQHYYKSNVHIVKNGIVQQTGNLCAVFKQ